jgi:hypothetical protein
MADKVNFSIKTGKRSILAHILPILHIRLAIDPSEASSKDDKFKLYSDDGTFEKIMTVKDDKVDGDAFVDLVFENLKVSKKYTLEVDPGAEGEPYKLFENIPYTELIDYYSLPDPEDELEEEEEEEDPKGEGMPDSEWNDDGGSGEFGGDADDDATEIGDSGDEEDDDDSEEDDGIDNPESVKTEEGSSDEEQEDSDDW